MHPRFESFPLYIQILQLLLDWTDFYIRLKIQRANLSYSKNDLKLWLHEIKKDSKF